MEFIQWKVWGSTEQGIKETPPTYYNMFRFSEDEKSMYGLDKRFEHLPTQKDEPHMKSGLRRNDKGDLTFKSDNLEECLNSAMEIFRSYLTISNNLE